ncbi:MAG: hypothetical protein WBC70_05280 [Candidatus Aminicenantales bacterium]
MKKYLGWLAALCGFAVVHEGMHAIMASIYGEYQSFAVRPYGLEVVYKTAVPERVGLKWGFISGASNVMTLALGYCLFLCRAKISVSPRRFLRNAAFWATVLFLLIDPFNLSVGPFFYGGDIGGLASGFGINRLLLQGFFCAILLFNRELIVRKLLPAYGVETRHPFFRPWLKKK